MKQTGTCAMCLQPDVPIGGCGFFAPDHCYACCAHKDIWAPVEIVRTPES